VSMVTIMQDGHFWPPQWWAFNRKRIDQQSPRMKSCRGACVSSRSIFSDVLQSIVRNVQEIVRSEVRLAKTELREGIVKAKIAALLLFVGALFAIFAFLFLLLTGAYALALAMPRWTAALIVGTALATIARIVLLADWIASNKSTYSPNVRLKP
jgi:uncharacterized membrane protein YqjE